MASMDDDYADDITTTGVIVVDGPTVDGCINSRGFAEPRDEDFFAIDLVAGIAYEFKMFPGTGNDPISRSPVLSLYDTGGTFLDWAFDGTSSNEAILFFVPEISGRFYLGARVNSTGDITGSYTMSAETFIPTIDGTPGDDITEGTINDDDIYGGAGDDIIRGNEGFDIILGGAGDDLIEGGPGGDLLDGGSGIDTVTFENSPSGVSFFGSPNGGDARDDAKFRNFENVIGSAFGDTLEGTGADNIIDGGDGDDRIEGNGGNDLLRGGRGNDVFRDFNSGGVIVFDGGEGIDVVDYVFGGSESLIINLGTGVWGGGAAEGDTFIDIEGFIGASGNDTLIGDANTNSLNGGRGNDTVDGGAGDDVIFASVGNDTLAGGDGFDTIHFQRFMTNVTVDLSTQEISGRDIDNDVISGFENVQGGRVADFITGSDGANILFGGDGADIIDGGDGDDIINGGDGGDTLTGGLGQDTISYEGSGTFGGYTIDLVQSTVSGFDTDGDTFSGFESAIGGRRGDMLIGNDQDNTLSGGSGDDTLTGAAGNDILIGGADGDTLDGGSGNDTASYAGSELGVRVSLAENGGVLEGDAAGDTLISIENLTGSAGDDFLDGSAENNIINGGVGRDKINGFGGDDFLSGGSDRDVLRGGTGADALDGGLGRDWTSHQGAAEGLTANLSNSAVNTGEAAGDTYVSIESILGTRYDDTLIGAATSGTIVGGAGNDMLFGLAEDDRLIGGRGDDELDGGSGADALIGGDGFDTVVYGTALSRVVVDMVTAVNGGHAAGDTFETVERIIGSAFNDTIRGDATANIFIGGEGDDTLVGRDGNDVLSGGLGTDSFNGGNGTDRVNYIDATAAVLVDLAVSSNNAGDAAGETHSSIENLIGSAFDDSLRGTNDANALFGKVGNDVLFGRGGDDRLIGGFGDDTLRGGEGADELLGGIGTDRVLYNNATSGVRVDLDNAAFGTGDAAGDVFDSIEDLTGSNFADNLRGDDGDNLLGGLGGRDTLIGRGGDDLLFGGGENDTLIGGEGADRLVGGAGSDTARYAGAAQGVKADLQFSQFNSFDAAGDAYVSVENLHGSSLNDDLRGDGGNNRLIGDDGDDVLNGRAGNDDLRGGDGNDVLTGGAGADALNGGIGSDQASYSDTTDGVRADLQFAQFNTGIASGDTYVSVEKLRGGSGDDDLRGDGRVNVLEGLGGRDFLTGRGGNDALRGGAGDDVLNGGEGFDLLVGGSGEDVFRFTALGAGVDILQDFTVGQDQLRLEGSEFASLSVGALSADNFRNGAVALDADDFILYDGRRLSYDADGDGVGAAVQIAVLSNNAVIDENDFVIV